MTKIVFYTDIGFFGGHEALTLDAARFLATQRNVEVVFLYSRQNSRMHKELGALVEAGVPIKAESIPFQSSTFQDLKSFLAVSEIRDVQNRLIEHSPDLVVAAQNRIEVSTVGVLAASRLGIPTISYLPLAHPLRVTGGSVFASALRERLIDYYYEIPDRFVTITKSMRQLILARRPSADVEVVYNGIDPSRYERLERKKARADLGFSSGDYLVGLIGRIQFRHKAQDMVVKTISAHRSQLENVKLLIVGDGPDKSKLYDILREEKISSHVLLLPWAADVSRVYSAIDMLMIPSWFEGMPMIMLEAMFYGLPIVASEVDAMKEFLPKDWLFPAGDGVAMLETLQRVRRTDSSDWTKRHREIVLEDFKIEDFGEEFAAAIGV